MAQGYADKLRSKLIKKATDATDNSKSENSLEFTPTEGTYKIRILPPLDSEDLFYHTHSFHWCPESLEPNANGKYLYAKKEYLVNGKKVMDPFDKAVKQFYDIGRKTNDDALQRIGGMLKRKRHYYANIILYTDEGPQFKVLVDKSNEGKLMRIICATMGIPFWRDIEDNWVDKTSLKIDEDREYYDLIDAEVGHDFKIVRKRTGANNWDFSYEDSFPINKSRALAAEEKEFLKQRVDLKTYVTYEEDYSVVKGLIDALVDNDEEAEEKPAATSKQQPAAPKVSRQTATVAPEDEAAIDELLNDLDD